VTLLMAYGGGFRKVLVDGFDAFGKSAVVARAGQTSMQAGGERAGRRIQFEHADYDAIIEESSLIRAASLEAMTRMPVSHGNTTAVTCVRGVMPDYGDIRNEKPSLGRWLSPEDEQGQRRVAFIGSKMKEKFFGNRLALNETIRIRNVSFTVVGEMETKFQLSNYFSPDDQCVFIPFSTAGQLWNTKHPPIIVFAAVAPTLEREAIAQFREILGRRHRFQAQDQRAINAFGREEFRPVIDAITIGLQGLLLFIGILTLAIGGIGLMNIMLVSVDERVREIGIRRALGAKRWHIRWQFLMEAMVITAAGGVLGMALSYGIAETVGTLPMLSGLFEDDSGKGDLHLVVSWQTLVISSAALFFVGLASAAAPAFRASKLDPADALRYE
jgi:putative ABC transport system permease protein